MGSFADGDVVGFSMTAPNCAKAVGVRSSIGMRIEGAGIEVGIFAARRPKGRGRKLRWVCGVGGSSGAYGATEAITIDMEFAVGISRMVNSTQCLYKLRDLLRI